MDASTSEINSNVIFNEFKKRKNEKYFRYEKLPYCIKAMLARINNDSTLEFLYADYS